jgi:hypothetical protein
VPDGKNDCKDGRNTVAVVVKNAGTADAEKLTVRLVVDDAQGDALERSLRGLEAGQEQEIRFEDVRLKEGEHALVATVAGKGKVGDSKENDELKVNARCTDAGEHDTGGRSSAQPTGPGMPGPVGVVPRGDLLT